jgi:hypothetical protein
VFVAVVWFWPKLECLLSDSWIVACRQRDMEKTIGTFLQRQ